MQNSEFEKNVQQKMEELKLAPADAVWKKIAARLPEEKKGRRWIIFILLFAVLATGSIIFLNKFKSNDKKIAQVSTITKEIILQNAIPQNKEKNRKSIAADIGLVKSTAVTNERNKKQGLKNTSLSATTFGTTPQTDLAVKNKQRLKTKGAVKITVKSPATTSETGEATAEAPMEVETISKTKNKIVTDTAILPTVDLIVATKKTEIDSLAVIKKDTIQGISKNKTKQKKNNLNWQYGIGFASGFANVKNNLFSSTPVFPDAFSNNVSGPPNPSIRIIPGNPSKGLALGFGFYAQKDINARWKFSTGLNYLYQSNTIKVGSRVDSVANFNFDINKSIAADYYYRPGNSASYKNKFHLIEIPILFQYKISKKPPLYFEGGPSLAFLLKSNALVYNSNSAAYFTNSAVFNKLLLSFNAGAGIKLAQKTKHPVTIGYRFNYSIGSVTKKGFGTQHLVNSLLYLKIPFKK